MHRQWLLQRPDHHDLHHEPEHLPRNPRHSLHHQNPDSRAEPALTADPLAPDPQTAVPLHASAAEVPQPVRLYQTMTKEQSTQGDDYCRAIPTRTP